jgi:hypothetical protein
MNIKLDTVEKAREFLDEIIKSLEDNEEISTYIDDLKWLSNQLYLLK